MVIGADGVFDTAPGAPWQCRRLWVRPRRHELKEAAGRTVPQGPADAAASWFLRGWAGSDSRAQQSPGAWLGSGGVPGLVGRVRSASQHCAWSNSCGCIFTVSLKENGRTADRQRNSAVFLGGGHSVKTGAMHVMCVLSIEASIAVN